MDLKERFEQYESEPSQAVWNGVRKGLRRGRMWRTAAWVAAGVAGAAVALWLAWPAAKEETAGMQVSALAGDVVTEVTVSTDGDAMGATPEVSTSPVVVAQASEVTIKRVPDEMPNPEPVPEVAAEPTPQRVAPAAPIVPADTVRAMAGAEMQPVAEMPEVVPTAVKPQVPPTAKLAGTTTRDSLMVWIPNAFSPDDPSGAEVRTFRVRAKESAQIQHFKMYIYNRSGAMVFHTTDIHESWNGTYKGAACAAGTYVYIVEYMDTNKGLQHARGTVTLIR